MKYKKNYSRREFVKQNTVAGVGAAVAMSVAQLFLLTVLLIQVLLQFSADKVRTKEWPVWPMWDQSTDEEQVIRVLRSGCGQGQGCG